jgi:hypothetical protein
MRLRSHLALLVSVASWLTGGPATADPCVDWTDRLRSLVDIRPMNHVYGIAVQNDHLFLAYDGLLATYDTADPLAPVLIETLAFTPGRPSNLVVENDLAFVARTGLGGTEGLSILEVSDPTTPVLLGELTTPAAARDVAPAGESHVLIAIDEGGVLVVDISEPTTPAIVHTIPPWGVAQGIAVLGDHALVAEGKLRIHDVSDPSSPVFVAAVPYPGVYWRYVDVAHDGDPSRVVAGRHYHPAGTSGWYDEMRISVIDVTSPDAPVEMGSVPCPGVPNHVLVSGGLAYVAYTTNESSPSAQDVGFQIVDISDPSVPVTLGVLGVDPAWSAGVALRGDRAFVAEGGGHYSGALQVVDISNPSDAGIQRVDSVAPSDLFAVRGGSMYVGREGPLEIRDADDPLLPLIATLPLGFQTALHVATDRLLLVGTLESTMEGVLHVIDLSDPANPTVTAELPLASAPEEIASVGPVAYVAQYSECCCDGEEDCIQIAEFSVIDLTDPGAPAVLATIPGILQPSCVAVAAGHVYVGNSAGIHVFDVSDPLYPVNVGSTDPGWVMSMASRGDVLFATVGKWDMGFASALVMLSVVDPVDPMVVGRLNLPGERALDVELDDTFAYVANDRSGVQLVDVTDPESPELLGEAYAGLSVRRVEVGTTTVFAVESRARLEETSGFLLVPRHGAAATPGAPPVSASPAAGVTLHPNPFTGSTTVAFTLGRRGPATLSVFDVRGRRVADLVSGMQSPRTHRVTWDGRDDGGNAVAAGVYWVRLESPDGVFVQKTLRLR